MLLYENNTCIWIVANPLKWQVSSWRFGGMLASVPFLMTSFIHLMFICNYPSIYVNVKFLNLSLVTFPEQTSSGSIQCSVWYIKHIFPKVFFFFFKLTFNLGEETWSMRIKRNKCITFTVLSVHNRNLVIVCLSVNIC